ncbi:hypothetical protein FOA19_07500 [Rufibacter hautae]|uniref:Uncharacterized protein n=1 Tax=Rufibacter hautae TaxID=2595005 RepID=A0A5B6TM43_9BACT|nr:hypothetical protein FOA19_07500 [Rufibacter hautae]
MFNVPSLRFWYQKSTLVLLSAFVLGGSACQDKGTMAPVVKSTHQAYDLVGFLDREAQALNTKKAMVRKAVAEDGTVKETKTITSLNWTEELAPFADADINKPALKGLFTVDSSSDALGQQVRRYTAKEDARTNVQEVTYTLDAKGQLVQLDATILQDNMLFGTKKVLHLEAHSGTAPHLVRYHLDETQKLLLMGAERYSVTGEVAQ